MSRSPHSLNNNNHSLECFPRHVHLNNNNNNSNNSSASSPRSSLASLHAVPLKSKALPQFFLSRVQPTRQVLLNKCVDKASLRVTSRFVEELMLSQLGLVDPCDVILAFEICKRRGEESCCFVSLISFF